MSIKLRRLRLKFIRFKRVFLPHRLSHFKLLSRHPFAVPFITFAVLVTLTGGIYFVARTTDKLPPVHDAKIVIISYDHQKQTVPSKEKTVGALLKKLDLKLNQGDVVEPAADTLINQDQFRINIYRAVPVEVIDGDRRVFGFSAGTTSRAIAEQIGVELYPEDLAQTDPVQDFIKSGSIGEQVIIDRATPIEVDLYGTPVTLRTHARTVEGLIKEKNIKLVKNDQVVPARSTSLKDLQKLSFIRTGEKVETVAETIPKQVQSISDPNLAYGTKAVRQQGSDGQQIVTYQVSLVNNVETGRTVMQKVVTKEPVTQIEVMGTSLSGIKGDMSLAGIAPGDYQYADFIISKESRWNPAARNASSGAYGLCQALPGSKMASAGSDWETNPVTQLRWCNGYAKSRFGGWAAAYAYWQSHHYW